MVGPVENLISRYQSTLTESELTQFKKLNRDQQLSMATIKLVETKTADKTCTGALNNLEPKSAAVPPKNVFPTEEAPKENSNGLIIERKDAPFVGAKPEVTVKKPDEKQLEEATKNLIAGKEVVLDGEVDKGHQTAKEVDDAWKEKHAQKSKLGDVTRKTPNPPPAGNGKSGGAKLAAMAPESAKKFVKAHEVDFGDDDVHKTFKDPRTGEVVVCTSNGENKYEYKYDSKGNLIQNSWKDSNGKTTETWEFKNNANGDRIQVTHKDANGKVKKVYDGKGNEISPTPEKTKSNFGELAEPKLYKPQNKLNIPKLDGSNSKNHIAESLSEYQNSNTFNMGKKFGVLHDEVVNELSKKFGNDPTKLAMFITNSSKGKCRLEGGKIVGNTIDKNKSQRESEPVSLVIKLAKALKDGDIDKPATKTAEKTSPQVQTKTNPALEEIKRAGIKIKKGGHFVYDKNSKALTQTYIEGGISKTEKYDANKKLISLESKYSSGDILTTQYKDGKITKKVLKTDKGETTFEGYVDDKTPTKSTKVVNGKKEVSKWDAKGKEWVKNEPAKPAEKPLADNVTKTTQFYHKGKLYQKEVKHNGVTEFFDGYNPVPGGKYDFTLKVVTDKEGRKTYYQRDPEGHYNKIR